MYSAIRELYTESELKKKITQTAAERDKNINKYNVCAFVYACVCDRKRKNYKIYSIKTL